MGEGPLCARFAAKRAPQTFVRTTTFRSAGTRRRTIGSAGAPQRDPHTLSRAQSRARASRKRKGNRAVMQVLTIGQAPPPARCRICAHSCIASAATVISVATKARRGARRIFRLLGQSRRNIPIARAWWEGRMTSRERQGWWIAGCLFFSLFLLWGSGYNTAGLFIAPLLKQFGWGRTQVSMLFAVLAAGVGGQFAVGGQAFGTRRGPHHHRDRSDPLRGWAGPGEPREFVRTDAGCVRDARPGTRLLDLRAHRAGRLELVRRAPRRRAGDRDGRAVARRDGDGAAGRLRDRERGMARR